MIRPPPRSTLSPSSAASDVYKRQKSYHSRRKLESTPTTEEFSPKTLKFITTHAIFESLCDFVKEGVINGICIIAGCSLENSGEKLLLLLKNLLGKGFLILVYGCISYSIAEKFAELFEKWTSMSSEGVQKVCRELDISPVIIGGSCFDVSRCIELIAEIRGGTPVGKDFPIILLLPNYANDVMFTIAITGAIAGAMTIIADMRRIAGGRAYLKCLSDEISKLGGGVLHFAPGIDKALDGVDKYLEQVQ